MATRGELKYRDATEGTASSGGVFRYQSTSGADLPARPPEPPVKRLPQVTPGTVATDGMDHDMRWAIFQQAKGRSRQTTI